MKATAKRVEFLLQRIEAVTNGKQDFADAICDLFPLCSRFQIHARVYKKEMRASLPQYLVDNERFTAKEKICG